MRKHLLAMTVIACALGSTTSQAAVVDLFHYDFNVDGLFFENVPPVTPPGTSVSLAGFSTTTGLGTITATFMTAGPHYFGVYLDHEIDEAINTFFNEFGATTGVPAAGQTWEIDEPGFVFGNIHANNAAGSLDTTNGVPSGSPEDVAMALAWAFTLAVGETASISVTVAETTPAAGFYLTHTDPDSPHSIYMSSTLGITNGGPGTVDPIPEPSTLILMSSLSLMGVSFGRFQRAKSKQART